MNLLIITAENFDNKESSGIYKKLLTQINAFSRAGFQVAYTYTRNGKIYLNEDSQETDLGRRGKLLGKIDVFNKIKSKVDLRKYQYFFLRYALSDFAFLSLLKKISRNKSKIVIEIPTYPYGNELKKGIKNRINLAMDIFYTKRLYLYVNIIATYSDDNKIWGIPVITLKNGYDFEPVSLKNHIHHDDQTLHMLAVANFGLWHGYERMIQGMGEYYAGGGKRKIVFHVVGEGAEGTKYKGIVKQYQLEKNVIFYGRKSGKELDELYDIADIGVCALGFHRVGVHRSSELKSREYAAKGLPIVAASNIDIFPDDFKYVLYVPRSDIPIDIEVLCAYCDSLYIDEGKEKVAEMIRNRAIGECDVTIFMQPVIDYYFGHLK